jgi:hypothetical protein
MKISEIHVGMQVKHPEYGLGKVKSVSEAAAEINFNTGIRTLDPVISGLQPAEPSVAVSGLEQPLKAVIEDMARAIVDAMGIEKPETVVDELGPRWRHGRLVLHPADAAQQSKEVPVEVFFHKVVMMRNNLRVLEQKINAHEILSDSEKVDLQQYITRCYGSMTTFNILFQSKSGQFATKE